MTGSKKNALVTGGTDGVGKEVARGLARAGHRVVLVGRDADKGARVERELRETTSNADVQFLQADLSLVREANRLADEIASRWPALHHLVHSAGVVRGRRELTAEGVESNFAINYLSRFALTMRLLPLLEAAGRPGEVARIVIVSGAAQHGTIHFDDVNLTENFTTLRAVWQFCGANDVFTVELARRLAEDDGDPHVTITSLKLGVVKTNIRREFPRWMQWLVPLVFDPLLAQTPQEAAESALRLVLAEDLEGATGVLFSKIKKLKQVMPTARVRNPEEGRRLWELSERLMAKAAEAAR
jgi:NAD(P)-dependent dehydrogenase (short-subunit alcohol dehydrogenase family)